MKKKAFCGVSLTIMLVALLSISIISCSKDDDGFDSTIAQEIIGTWYAIDSSNNRYCTITFYSDGSGDFFSEYHGKYGKSNSEMTGEFTWKCEGNMIITYGDYVYINYNNGTVDTDYDPEVIYYYNGSTITGGRYSGDASIYTRDRDNSSTGGNNTDDLTCHVGFDNSVFATIYQNGKYIHEIFLGFGVSEGHHSAGINEFGIAVKTSDGTITNANSKKSGDVYVSTLHNYKYFSGLIFDDKAYEWGTIIFVESKSKKVVLDYYIRYYNSKTKEWVEGDNEKFTYEPEYIVNN